LVEKYFDGSIDLEMMQTGLNGEINNLESLGGQDLRKVVLRFEACVEDVRFTISEHLQKREIERYYEELLLPVLNEI
jgi:hypothetical protein